MDVTDVLRDRVNEPAGLERMITVSVAVHAAAVAFLILAPGDWLGRASPASRSVMTISLGGGGEGPLNGGMTTMGGAPVQVQKPPDEPTKKEPVRPPAAKPPEMVIAKSSARATRTPPPTSVKQAPDDARGRTPTKGAQTSAGSAIANTAVRGQGFGLSTGGGPGSGSTLDVADFCCPDYLILMISKIRQAWNQNQGGAGLSVVKFTIQRDGTLSDVPLFKSSGNSVLDNAAQRAIIVTRQLPPLPDAFSNPTLTVRLNFDYQ